MIDTNMPDEVVRAQKQRIVSLQFDGLEEDDKASLMSAIDNEASAA
jgi:hypothetical protein